MKIIIKISIIIFLIIIISIIIIPKINESNTTKWSNKEIISLENSIKSYRQNILIDTFDTIHLSWKGKIDNESFNIYYKYKIINENWSETQIINPDETNESHCLSMGIDTKNTIHIVWLDETDYLNSGNDKDIYYRYKQLNQNLSDIELISNESKNDCNCPSISIKNEEINIIWPDRIINNEIDNDIDLYLKSKKIDKKNWNKIELITINSNSDSLVCEIEEDNLGKKHVVWQEKNSDINESNNYNIYYSFKDIGENWTEKELISSNKDGNCVSPSIEIDSRNTIHLIWIDNTNNLDSGYDYDVYYRYKEYNNDWSEIELISVESKENCNWPYIKIDSKDNIHVAWADKTNYSNGNDYDIVYKKKSINGIWTPIEIVSIDSKYDSNWPRFDIDSKGKVHMTWWDDINPNWIMYYEIREL